MKKLFISICCILMSIGGIYAATPKKTSAINNGTTVRAKVTATGLYSQECYDAYYGCMDEFCVSDNANGGSCLCSDDNEKYEKELKEIDDILVKAEKLKTEEVERVKAGAAADIIFNGTRQYDDKGNVVYKDTKKETKAKKRADLMAMFETKNVFDDEVVFDTDNDIATKKGAALFNAAEAVCKQQIDSGCTKELNFLHQLYKKQIDSDCRGFANSVANQRKTANATLSSAEADVRAALKESLDSANKYGEGECLVEFRNCMQTSDACGPDWSNCVSVVATGNMQKKTKTGIAVNTKKIDISASVMEILDSKRKICERVLDSCMAVRDNVWPDFLREVAPALKVAELNQESKFRQSCLTNITKCLRTACAEDIAAKGTATMDACLSRPEMARSFCKVEFEPCLAMESQIWEYVKDRLAAMRVDACTQEVKDCFTADTRCGPDFMNCIGMDFEYMQKMCPVDKLVACKKNGQNMAQDDLNQMLLGLYLNIDNKALENCQDLVEKKMIEVCGSTTDCNKFAADDTMGTGSLHSQKTGNLYRITGMISFGSLDLNTDGIDNTKVYNKDFGKFNNDSIQNYMANVAKENSALSSDYDYDAIAGSIEAELNNVKGNIDRVIDMIALDPQIQYCVTGRNMAQITGKDEDTVARFPNLLNQIKLQISMAALRKAQDNYNAKFNEYVAKATKDASADVAQYMCQMMPVSGGATVGAVGGSNSKVELHTPYAIAYEVGRGLNNKILAQGGHGSGVTGTNASVDTTAGASKVAGVVDAFTGLAGQKVKSETGSGTREMWSIFNRETRVCHYCTSIVTKSCSTVSKKGFLGIGSTAEASCEESAPIETCRDIEM